MKDGLYLNIGYRVSRHGISALYVGSEGILIGEEVARITSQLLFGVRKVSLSFCKGDKLILNEYHFEHEGKLVFETDKVYLQLDRKSGLKIDRIIEFPEDTMVTCMVRYL